MAVAGLAHTPWCTDTRPKYWSFFQTNGTFYVLFHPIFGLYANGAHVMVAVSGGWFVRAWVAAHLGMYAYMYVHHFRSVEE